MRLISKLTFLAGVCVLLTSSCMIGSIADRIAEATDDYAGTDDAILLTKNTYPVSSVQQLRVSTSGGSIEVIGDTVKDAVIEIYVKPNNNRSLSKGEIQEILDRDYEIVVQQREGILEAYAKRKNNLNWRNTINISFRVHTGNKVTTDLSTSGGSIQLANLSGRQNFKTSGGSLEIDNLEGNITGRTSGGGIRAYNSNGIISLSTSGGSIKLEELTGDIDVSTSGGSIKGNSIRGSLLANTSGGSIDFDNLTGPVNASSSGGSLTFAMNELLGDVRLSTSGGNVNLLLPQNTGANLDFKGSGVNLDGVVNFQGSNNKGKLNGSINGGGANIQASTSGGNVNLTVR